MWQAAACAKCTANSTRAPRPATMRKLVSTISGLEYPLERLEEFADNGEALEVALSGLERARRRQKAACRRSAQPRRLGPPDADRRRPQSPRRPELSTGQRPRNPSRRPPARGRDCPWLICLRAWRNSSIGIVRLGARDRFQNSEACRRRRPESDPSTSAPIEGSCVVQNFVAYATKFCTTTNGLLAEHSCPRLPFRESALRAGLRKLRPLWT